jgi:tRNA pseudouridine55 synthase
MGKACDGIVLIDKNEGETSFDVVRRVRKFLKIKKVGHAGTLDPFATGLLIVLLGQGTKLSPYLMSREKKYRATLRLGVETDTQDPTGRVLRKRPVPAFDLETIKEHALGFVGEAEQSPPIFSAVKYRGKRAYKLARKGITPDLKKRKVMIRSLEIVSVDLPEVTLEVTCSSGTYIRSLAADLGEKLGPGAHLKALRRQAIGPFSLRKALDSKKIGLDRTENALHDRIIPLRDAIPHLKEVQVDDKLAHKIRNGFQPQWEALRDRLAFEEVLEGQIKLVEGGALVAIMKVPQKMDLDRAGLEILRVFH